MIEQAAFWSAQLATDEASQADRDACEAWCREHPLHRLAMERMRGFDTQFDSTDHISRETITTMLERRSRNGNWRGGLTLGLALLAGCGWLMAQSITVRGWFPDYETARGEQRTITLVDGSGVTVDTDASLDFRRNETARIVTLFRGQILVRVAKDEARPFIVETRDGTAAARGTAFIVRRDEDATSVTVIESRVQACLENAGAEQCVDLLPGDRVRLAHGRIQHLEKVDPETAAMWADGWLAVDDQPVSRVLLELNRYREKPILFDAGELAGVNVSGSFPLADPDRALDGIVRLTGLRLFHAHDGSPMVGRAK